MIYFHVYSASELLCFMGQYVAHNFSVHLARILTMLTLQIRDTDSTLIVAQLLFLEAEETSKPIHLYINSPGGSVTAGLAIYDTVRNYICFHIYNLKIPDAGATNGTNNILMLH